jgi:hypothetical protein
MSITAGTCAVRGPFGVGPLPRATPACMHAGGPARGNPAGRGLAKLSTSHKSLSVEHGRGLLSSEPVDRTAVSPAEVQSRSGSERWVAESSGACFPSWVDVVGARAGPGLKLAAFTPRTSPLSSEFRFSERAPKQAG